MTEHTQTIKHGVDALSVWAAIMAFIGWLPTIAAGLSAVWTVLRLVEMVCGRTISDMLRRK